MSVFTSDHEPRILKQMVDRFPFELLQKSAAKGRSGNKKSKENADNDDSADIAVAQVTIL
jgi:hypothetical protein